MTGCFCVKRLNKSGNYKSEISTNDVFGLFKMIIHPIENSFGQNEIRYMKTDNGIIVSGEAYIISGEDDKEVEQKSKRYTSQKWENLIQKQVYCSEELW